MDKYSFWTLLEAFDKIEIPIIQREYAQGRTHESKIRERFVRYLATHLQANKPIELDFVYGTDQTDGQRHVFIPLDGQQRLTTLFLLHWLLAVKAERLDDEMRQRLSRFTYETRIPAHDFCNRLCHESFSKDAGITTYIRQQTPWYNPAWDNDSTVSGMLTMLDSLEQSEELMQQPDILLNRLTGDAPLITFYFVSLHQFGLTEELYIRMNARGKALTEFEHFKSEFYKMLVHYPSLDSLKEKMEYAWVEALWNYRAEDYTVDQPFMNYLAYITEMLYFEQAAVRADNYQSDFLDLDFLGSFYSDHTDRVDFLVFALDILPTFHQLEDRPLLWEEHKKNLVSEILRSCIVQNPSRSVDSDMLVYATLLYLHRHGVADDAYWHFIRVVRNLIHNTEDKSRREWPRLIASIRELLTDQNVYTLLATRELTLDGFRVLQRDEERFKANLLVNHQVTHTVLFEAEDHAALQGQITPLLVGTCLRNGAPGTEQAKDTAPEKDFSFTNVPATSFDATCFAALFDRYRQIAADDFNLVWGDLLCSPVYIHHTYISRLTYDPRYTHNPGTIRLAQAYLDSQETDLATFLEQYEKQFVRTLSQQHPDLAEVRDVKEQLYLYYIITRRLLKRDTFFKRGGYNFGWLEKESGYTSLFRAGIADDPWFGNKNPIFQLYDRQFRFNMGINSENTLDIETNGSGRPHNCLQKLQQWANQP